MSFAGSKDDPKWGHVADKPEIFGDHPDVPGKRGLLRVVGGDVQYAAPPAGRTWAPVKNARQTFFMELERVSGNSSLFQFADRLSDQASDEHLQNLDEIVQMVMDLALRLHSQNCGLGMITPESVIIRPSEIILCDIGFFFQGQFPPAWYRSPRYAGLWDFPVEIQQQHGIVATQAFDPRPDVRTLARIWQGMLVGKWQKSIVSKDARARTQSPRLWQLLDTAIKGDLSLAKFGEELLETPLSNHFRTTQKNEVHPRRRRRYWLGAGLTLGVAAIVATGAWYLDLLPTMYNSDGGGVREEIVDVPQPIEDNSAVEQALSDVKDNDPDRAKHRDALIKADAAALATADEVRQQELGRISYRRGRYFEEWSNDFEQARFALGRPAQKSEAYTMLCQLRDELKEVLTLKRRDASAQTLSKELQCLDAIRLLAHDPQMPREFLDSLQGLSAGLRPSA